jgi:hypothetical protein
VSARIAEAIVSPPVTDVATEETVIAEITVLPEPTELPELPEMEVLNNVNA